MAFQSTFTGNIKPLEDAIKGATPVLNNFEQNTKKVQTSLQRMVSEFDGSKLISQANVMVGAIDKIGGATKLTADEQRKVNSTLEDAVAKYRALGQQAPAAMLDLLAATKKVDDATEQIPKKASLVEASFGRIGTIAAGAFAGLTFDRIARGVTDFAAKTIEAGGRINDLASKLGVSTSAIQRWDFAAKQNGNTVEQLGQAVTQMSNRLVEGNASAVSAVAQLGLNFQEIRSQSPERAFEEIASAIAKVPDPMRQAALAMDLFGKSGAEILPTIKGDIRELGDEADRLGLVMSDSTISALDNLGDSLDKVSLAGQGVLARVFTPMVPLIDAIANAAIQASERLADFSSELARINRNGPSNAREAFQVGLARGTPGTALLADLENLGLALEEVTGPKVTGSIEQFSRQFKGLSTDVVSADRATAAMSKTVAQQNKLLRDWTAAAERRTEEEREWLGLNLVERANALVDIYRRTNQVLPATTEQQKRVNDELSKAAPMLRTVTPLYAKLWLETFPAAVPVLEGIPKFLLDINQQAANAVKPVSLLTAELKELGPALSGLPSNLPGQQVAVTIPKPPANQAKDFASSLVGNIGDVIVQSIAGGGDTSRAVAAVIGRDIGKELGKQLGKALGSTVGAVVGDIGGAIAGEVLGNVFDKILKTEGKKVNDIRDQFVLAAGGIGELDKRAHEAGLTLRNFLKADTVNEYNAAILELERAFQKLEARVRAAVSQLGRISEQGQLLNDPELLRTLSGSRDRPEVRDALGSFIESQTNAAIDGISTFLSIRGKDISVGTAEATGAALTGLFGSLVDQGASPLQAIERLAPAINELQSRLAVLGVDGGAAFQGLLNFARHAADEISGPVFQAVAGLGQGLVGLANTGGLTQEVFSGLSRGIFDSFRSLELMGKGGIDAARGMQQPLQRTWELVQDFGFSVDEDTQKLLDFAESSGLIGDKFRPAADRMASSIDALVKKLDVFIAALENKLVNSAQTAADGIEDSLNGIRVNPVRITWDVDGVPVPGGGFPEFASGSGGIRDFGSGTMAVLHGREAVMTEAQMRAFATSGGDGGVPVNLFLDRELLARGVFKGGRNLIRSH